MRIGSIFEPTSSGNNYRSLIPLRALEAHGHQVVWPDMATGVLGEDDAFYCDVVLVYRAMDMATLKLVHALGERGIGVVYDNDDDFLHGPVGPSEVPKVWRDRLKRSLAVASKAHVVTVTTAPVRAIYAERGIADVRVVPNLLTDEIARPRPRRHKGVVVGWIGGHEHGNDARVLRLSEALGRVQRERPDVHVECIGIDLELPERYRFDWLVNFDQLPARMATWDIGLAPIADNPFNLARSDIKVKEYAASRVPWLASGRGPYAPLGEQHGGRLVGDDGWFDAVAALAADRGARRRLSKAGHKWARTQYVDDALRIYEAVFADAIARAQAAAPEARLQAS